MQLIACWCALLTPAQFSDTEYAGRAYVDRADQVLTLRDLCKREALILCVHAGIGPDLIEKLFGEPSVRAGLRASPIEWWYAELGVTVYWPARLFKLSGPVKRVEGSIQPN
jgi:hypothetical protein